MSQKDLSNSAKKKNVICPKTPKGTRDFTPSMVYIRDKVFSTVTTCFKKYGAESIETPVFELKETLLGKYGEDSKLIYDLADQGGEMLSLRYDLTVPFARYVAQNKIDKMKRYQIAKVYRRDNPSMGRGRYREFYQCDFDIAGSYETMFADVECFQMIVEILTNLNIGKFIVKINHRKLIDGIMEICGVPSEKIRHVSSSIDKLDKLDWESVYKEMTEEKGLDNEIAMRLKPYLSIKGNFEDFKKLRDDENAMANKSISEGLKELELFKKYSEAFGIEKNVLFDMSMVRGIDYYTGIIFEAIQDGEISKDCPNVGSIVGGGRYDELVGMFDRKKRKVPCVGFSVGIERIFTLIDHIYKTEGRKIPTKDVKVFVASAHKGLVVERQELVKFVRDAGISAEYMFKTDAKFLTQLQYCEENMIPLCIIIGDDEIKSETVKLRVLATRHEKSIKRSELLKAIDDHFV